MVWYAETLWCDGCGVEIHWSPLESADLVYCCTKCLQGERCPCSDLPEDYPPTSEKQDQDISFINQ